jgi:hypothetical protein
MAMIEGCLGLFPNEAVFSGLWRYTQRYRASTHLNKRESRNLYHPELTPNLGNISKLLGSTPEVLLNQHTGVPLYQLSLPENEQEVLIQILVARSSISDAALVARLPSSHLRLSCNYRLCLSCLKRDIKELGMYFWHTEHQLPGVLACIHHAEPLMQNKKLEAYQNSQHLPLTTHNLTYQLDYGCFVFDLWKHLQSVKKLEPTRTYVSKGVVKRGFMLSKGRVSNEAVSNELQQTIKHLGFSEYLCAGGLVSRFFHKKQAHPTSALKTLVLLYFLHKCASDMIAAPNISDDKTCHHRANKAGCINEEDVCNRINQGESINAIARSINRSRCLVKRIGRQHGLLPGIREYLGAVVYLRARKQALAGHTTKDIAHALGITVGSAERVISEDKSLASQRKAARFQRRRHKYRQVILGNLKQYAFLHRTNMKKSLYKEYYWLFKYDKAWLIEHCPAKIKPSRYKGVKYYA